MLSITPVVLCCVVCHAMLWCLCHQAEVQSVKSVVPINAWAARVTNGMITQAVPPNTEFNCVITNAVYFKGKALVALHQQSHLTQQALLPPCCPASVGACRD